MAHARYVVGADGEKIPADRDDGELVTCDVCGLTVDEPRGTTERVRWYLRLTIATDAGPIEVVGDVCTNCRAEPLADVAIALAGRLDFLAPDVREAYRAAFPTTSAATS